MGVKKVVRLFPGQHSSIEIFRYGELLMVQFGTIQLKGRKPGGIIGGMEILDCPTFLPGSDFHVSEEIS
jgi:hypothetical protein